MAMVAADDMMVEKARPLLKPVVKLVGQDGNVFNLLGICTRALKRAGQSANAAELQKKVFSCGSYDEALGLMMDYVIVEGNDYDEEEEEEEEEDDGYVEKEEEDEEK